MPYLPGAYADNTRPPESAEYPNVNAGQNFAYPYRPQASGGLPRNAVNRIAANRNPDPRMPHNTPPGYTPQRPSYPPVPPSYSQQPYAYTQSIRTHQPQAAEQPARPQMPEEAPEARSIPLPSAPISGWKAWPILLRISGVALSALFALSGLWFGIYLMLDVQPFYGTLVLLTGLLMALFVICITVVAVRLLRHISK